MDKVFCDGECQREIDLENEPMHMVDVTIHSTRPDIKKSEGVTAFNITGHPAAANIPTNVIRFKKHLCAKDFERFSTLFTEVIVS